MAETPASPVPAGTVEVPTSVATGEAPAPGGEPDMAAVLASLEADFPAGSPEATAIGDKPPEAPKPAEPAPESDKPAEAPAEQPVGDEPSTSEEVQAARKILATAARKERKALEAVPKAEAALLKQFTDDPHAFLAKAGISIKDWLARVAASAEGAAPTEDDIAARTKRLEEAQEAQRIQAEAETAQRLTRQVIEAVEGSSAFPLIAQEKAAAKVPAKMIAYHKHYGKACSIEHAAKLVEADLRASGKKLPAPARAAAPATQATSTRPASATMTNDETRGQPVMGDLPDDPDARLRAVIAELG